MANQPPFAVLANAVSLPLIKSTTKALTLNYFGFVDGSTSPEASQFLAKYSDGAAKDIHPTIATFLRITQDDCVGNAV